MSDDSPRPPLPDEADTSGPPIDHPQAPKPTNSGSGGGGGRRRLGFLFFLDKLVLLALFGSLIAAFAKGRWAGCGEALAWFIGLLFVHLLLILTKESTRYGTVIVLAPLAIALAVLWLYTVGTVDAYRQRDWSTLAWDLAPLAVAALLTWLVSRLLGKIPWPGDAPITVRQRLDWEWGSVQALTWFVLAWILVSVVTVLRVEPLPREEDRWSHIAAEVDVPGKDAWSELRLGLALSGGGYRAAVFHAGVLQSLEELGLAPANLSTVSGGSIIGSYYSLGGDPAAFVDAVAAGRFDLKRQLLSMHNALRLPFPMRLPGTSTELLPLYSFDRLDVQTAYLDRILLPPAKSCDTRRHTVPRQPGPDSTSGPPHLMIATTDLTYGFQVGLLPDGVLLAGGAGERDVLRGSTFQPEEELSLADRVALSGAFPGAFPARRWRARVAPLRGTGRGQRDLVLVDGGVRDNLGVELLRAARALAAESGEGDAYTLPAHWRTDALLVSDGGAAFGVLQDGDRLLTQVSRTVEVAGTPLRGSPSFRARNPDGTDRSLRAVACEEVASVPHRFSPALRLPSPSQQFLVVDGPASEDPELADPRAEDAAAGAARRGPRHNTPRMPGFDPSHYPEPVLQRLVELLPTPHRAEATEWLDAYLTTWGTHRTRSPQWSQAFDHVDEHCSEDQRPETILVRGRRMPLLPGMCEGRRLRKTVLEALRDDLLVFYDTPTLADRLAPDTAAALERLGRMLVYIDWPLVEKRLRNAALCASGEPATAPLTGAPGEPVAEPASAVMPETGG